MMKESNTPPSSNGHLKIKTQPADHVPSTTTSPTPIPKPPSSLSSLSQLEKSKSKNNKKKKMKTKTKTKKWYKIKTESALWFVVLIMAGMIVVVNYMLLQIQDEDSLQIDESFRQQSNQQQQQQQNNQQQQQQQQSHHHHSMLSPEKDPTLLNKEKTTEELGPLLEILKYAGIEDTPELRMQLPTWDQVVHRYGSKPIIYGLETCEEFNKAVPPKQRFIAPAGPFNSGTNLIWALLLSNCRIAGRRDRMAWQVNWGKHQPPRYRFKNYVNKDLNNTHYLPLVMVRDPWTWMHSMCRHRYTAKWLHAPEHCPNLIPNEVEGFYHDKKRAFLRQHFKNYTTSAQEQMFLWKAVLDRAIYHHGEDKTIPIKIVYKNGMHHHKSLAHFWKEWYQEYWDATFPRLFIRLEDLVFYPRQVLKTTCECVGGKFIGEGSNLQLKDESPKEGQKAHGKNLNNLATNMANHVFFNRTKGMTHDDIQYAKEVLDDSIFNDFGYHPPF